MSNPNSNQAKLNLYIRQLHQRLRLGVSLRGVAILMATALITTILLVLDSERVCFSRARPDRRSLASVGRVGSGCRLRPCAPLVAPYAGTGRGGGGVRLS